MKGKGYLKTAEGLFSLSPKITTIGKEACDLVIQCTSVDPQHATIEVSDSEDCYVLKDLDSTQGTYVNDCRVQNAAVRLAPGDVIRIGFSGQQYEFYLDTMQQQVHYPPVSQRGTWQPITVLTDSGQGLVSSTQLPDISAPASSQAPAWAQAVTSGQATPPLQRPPSGHQGVTLSGSITTRLGRPISAGSGRRTQVAPTPATAAPSVPPVTSGPGARGGWVTSTIRTQNTGSPTLEISMLQEKEQRIFALQAEMNRLQAVESESATKDKTIESLRIQLAQAEQKSQLMNQQAGDSSDLRNKLAHLQVEVSARQAEVASLKDHLNRLHESRVAEISDDPGVKAAEVNTVRIELERVKKDKQITAGLVTQLQRDMASKDSTISRLTREIESLKKEIKDKDVTISAIQAKFTRLKDNKKAEEEREAREKELFNLRQKFKATENKVQDQLDIINSMKEEVDAAKVVAQKEAEGQKRVLAELEAAKNQFVDMQRTERIARVDAQEATKRYERFRNRVMQVAFSTPGVRYPEGEIKDDQLIEMLKKVVDERTEFHKKVGELKENIKIAENSNTKVSKAVKKFGTHFAASTKRLSSSRCTSSLKDELTMLTAQSVSDESLQPIKDSMVADLQNQLSWSQDIDSALEKCGVTVKISSDNPGQHIRGLFAKWEEALSERDRLRSRLAEVENNCKTDMERCEARLAGEMEGRIAEAVEKAKLEAEEASRKAIDEVVAAEQEKMQVAETAAKDKEVELQAQLSALQQSLLDRGEEEDDKLKEARSALERLAASEANEAALQEQVQQLIMSKEEALAGVAEQVQLAQVKCDKEVEGYKEQVRQHSVTICAMEERLNKVVKQNKDLQNTITKLKEENADFRAKAAAAQSEKREPQTPKVIIQKPTAELAALERTIVALRQENASLKVQIKDHVDVIEGLRRDLTGASARLSDIRGELTDAQKEEMEGNRNRLRAQEAELSQVRGQLAQLSNLVDQLKNDLQIKDGEAKKWRDQLEKLKNTKDESESRLKEMNEALNAERSRADGLLDAAEEEGRISAEMSALGHQCRGERHSQIIAHQKEALAELRTRVKQLESMRPPVPSHDQAVQQVVLLKKELAELRSRQALQETKALPAPLQEPQLSGPAATRVTAANADLDAERSAHRETLDSLDLSEATYLSLLRAMASNLELESVQGLRSMAHLPRDERERLQKERDASTELLSQRIKVLKERLQRKEELLQGYERDLARLRQAEELAVRKGAQVESLVQDVRSKTEESQLLRESLSKTKDMLHQEKRLNTAIKQKKTFHLENEHPKPAPKPKYHCPPEDLHGREAARRKVARDKAKRKDYEVRTLKSELTAREQELCKATTRLVNMETTLGLRNGEME